MTLLDPAPPRARPARTLAQPDVVSALQGLAALVGPVEALRLWQAAALATGHHGTDLSCAALLEVAAALRAHGGTAAVFATSLSARVRAHLVLSRTPQEESP